METATDSQKDIDRFAVIRHYEPTRIERELLAQVFEIVSHRPEHDSGQVDHESAATILCSSQVADEGKSPRDHAPKDAARRESMEPAA
jgi:hypothetical protein